ncbi:MAG: hypothetical protein C0490_28205 [Marivirga sp.]|nr:hypothetical protein [Marivirga sp.]
MKRMLLVVALLLLLSACDVYVVEPRYDPRDKVIGQYDVEEYSETYNDLTYYSFYITKSGYSREIRIDNFYASDIRVYAYLDYDKVTIPYQVVDGYEIEGVGTAYGSYIKLSYRVKDVYSNSYTDFCETEATRY